MADGPIDSEERRGTYKGPLAHLKGKTAQLIVYASTGRCLAQFDDVETGYAHGRHDFETAAFDLEPVA